MSSILSNASLLSKFRGSIIGTLVGDCLGAPYEDNDVVSKTVLGKYLSTLLNGGSSKVFPYTDDTCMTMSVANSIIENKEVNPEDLARRFVSEFYKKPSRGYGENVRTVFDALRQSEFQDVLMPARLQFNGSGSYGNGAAMRIAPVALFAYNKDDTFLKKCVEDCSSVTHTHPNGVNGALLQCFAVHAALHLDASQPLDPLHFISQLEKRMLAAGVKKSSLLHKSPYFESLKKIKKIYEMKQEDISPAEIAEYLGNDVSAHRSVPTAIYSFLRGLHPIPDFECCDPFVRTLYFAILVGGDTDTIAAMAGAISGAFYGAEGIPQALRDTCEAAQEVSTLGEKLFQLTQDKV